MRKLKEESVSKTMRDEESELMSSKIKTMKKRKRWRRKITMRKGMRRTLVCP